MNRKSNVCSLALKTLEQRFSAMVAFGILSLAAGSLVEVRAALWLPHSLSDHILFQQKEPIVVWGRSAPHSKITVEMLNASSRDITRHASAVADGDGRWRLALKPLPASFQKYLIKMMGDGETRLIQDVLIGELWLTSGQSNMDLPLRYIIGGRELIASATNHNIRIFSQQVLDKTWWKSVPQGPVEDTADGRWLPAQGTNIAQCSGVAYTFALALYDALNQRGKQLPVGVMNTAVGATGIASWMSRSSLEADPELREKLPSNWNVGDWKGYNQPWGQATALFNLKIAPLTPHAVRGFLWYQGESDAGYGESGAAFYKKAQTALIEDWRKLWGGQKRPFIFSQLHAYDEGGKMPPEDLESWAYLREAQFEVTQNVPETAAIPIHDVSLNWDYGDFGYKGFVHPLDKKPVGERIALAARGLAYGQSVDYTGPVFERMTIAGSKAILRFRNARGLKASDGEPLVGFAICGPDRHFAKAEARIVDGTVHVTNPTIPNPVAVTYGFTSMNHCANLFNGHNLPAFPFRTDKVKSSFLKGCTGPQ